MNIFYVIHYLKSTWPQNYLLQGGCHIWSLYNTHDTSRHCKWRAVTTWHPLYVPPNVTINICNAWFLKICIYSFFLIEKYAKFKGALWGFLVKKVLFTVSVTRQDTLCVSSRCFFTWLTCNLLPHFLCWWMSVDKQNGNPHIKTLLHSFNSCQTLSREPLIIGHKMLTALLKSKTKFMLVC